MILAHPLFRALIGAALDYSDAERLPVQFPEAEQRARLEKPSRNGVYVPTPVSTA